MRHGLWVVVASALSLPAWAQPAAADDLSSADDLDLVELLRLGGELKVVSASQQAEPVREAPVPVTIITREMIEESGARNLLELLTLYVPGMTRAEDHNELNVAMRGVYASSQQKILFLLDGHRLNSRAYSAANPDFSIALNHIKRVEVLRGPGSSIYGNVALTAVINIVTLSGGDVNGARVRAGLGSHGQLTGNLLVGGEFGGDGEVMGWAHFFEAAGQRVSLYADPVTATGDARLKNYSGVAQDGFALVGGARQTPSHDAGLRARLGKVQLLANHSFGKHTEPLTAAGTTGEVYRFDDQTRNRFMGLGPGLASSKAHLGASWSDSFGASKQFTFSANAYYDSERLAGVTTSTPAGGAIFIGWDEWNVGTIFQGRYDYSMGALGEGNVLAGFQWEYMKLEDSILASATNTVWSTFADQARPLLEPGREIIYSGFVMARHKVADALVLNLGARYDNKFRHDGPNVTNVSPRLALAYAPKGPWDVKLSYAESFVDAPYWYRYNSLASYRGARTLTPEQMRSLQLTGSVALLDSRLKTSLNLFYNHLYNFIFRNNNAAPTEPIYQNAGYLTSMGAEAEVSWTERLVKARLVGAYQHALASKDYGVTGSVIHNVSPLSASLSVDVAPLPEFADKFFLHVNGRYLSRQWSPVNLTFPTARFDEPNRAVEGALILDLGLRLKNVPVKKTFIGATVTNLLDTFYEQGGSTTHPYPQAGRWFLITAGYDFEL